jgi:tRNA 5-methylaminomethyl-2-thiouridine biosynthesis bifunctional protein
LSPSPISNEALLQRKAIIIGAGVAGACTARSLADRGWDITVLEKNTIASGASGNPAAIVSIIPCSTSDILTHFPQQASLHTLRVLQKLFPEENTIWHACGLVELPATSHQKTFSGQQQNELPDNLWRKIDGATVSTISGATITTPAVFQPQSGWLDAQQWCRFLLNHPLIKTQENTDVLSLLWDGLSWQIKTSTGLISTPVIILANGFDALSLLPDCPLPLRVVRGQVSRIKPSPLSSPLKTIVASNCYLSPPDNAGLHCLGATFTPDDLSTEICAKDHEDLRLQLKKILPDIADSFADCGNWKGRSSIRCQSEDYLPLVGAIATKSFVTQHYAGLRHGKLHDYPPLQPLPNLYVNIAHGSHGFSHALLAAEILVSEMLQEPSPCAQKMRENLHPIRFLIRQLKRGKI